jgi:predicted site-specific integrase-resolvase
MMSVQVVTPEDLALQLGVSAKTIRAWLRTVYKRPAEEKNAPWYLNAEQAVAVVRKYG